MRAAEQKRPDVARKRRRWPAHQAKVDPRRLVFIDETWVKTNMAPLRGWGPRSERLEAHVPHGHWRTLTFIGAVRHDWVTATWAVDGSINGEVFRHYLEHVLASTLKAGDVVVLDNLGSHKTAAVRTAIRAIGVHFLLLPPYSPDLNPIEQLFAKLKHLPRNPEPRIVDTVWKQVGKLLDLFSPNECANYLTNLGYAVV